MSLPASPAPRAGRGSRVVLFTAAVIMVALAIAWSLVAQRQMAKSIAAESSQYLDRARAMFGAVRQRVQDRLRAECRVLVEDPRLKVALATEGMDEATVADILGDVRRLRGAGFLMVLSPDGRVFAQVGADELRGLDLSASSVIKKVQTANDAVSGSWVIGGQLVDLSVTTIRYDAAAIAYLVVGLAVDQQLLKAIAEGSGAALALATGGEITIMSSDELRPAFTPIANEVDGFKDTISASGVRYVATVTELELAGQSRPRLVVLRALTPMTSVFEVLWWLLLVPPVLVVIAIILSRSIDSTF
jgi:hypothetical protein